MTEKKTIKVKYPIVVKLILIISSIIFISSAMVTFISTLRYSEDSRARAEKNNFDMNELQATQVENYVNSITSTIYLLFDTFRTIQGNKTLETITLNNFWLRNANIASIILPGEKELYNTTFFRANELDTTIVQSFLENYKEQVKKAKAGSQFIFNAAPVFGFPVAGMMIPYKDFGTNNVMIIFFSTEELQARLYSSTVYRMFIVNNEGDVLLDDDFDTVLMGSNRQDHPVVADMITSPVDNKQIRYKENDHKQYFGAYRKITTGGIGVITMLAQAEVTAVVNELFIGNIYLTLVILFISVLIVYYFSKTISKPIRSLTRATIKIEEGNYKTDIYPTTQDELGILTESFVAMSRGLEERERIKHTFGKFVNKQIAEQALQGNLTLGGVRKEATIFFSDIRSFTAISESLMPEQVVEFLNDYMSRMVTCVNNNAGVVDKFIGDAIMALWGVPVSSGTPQDDALNAIKASLKMRYSLIEFNKDRGSPDKPVIKIGCGLNTGPAIAGQIGSEERMEYTVIGDAVNLASRIEALNKPFCTDILISENTYNLVKDHVIVETMPFITVKGKAAPLQIYAVVNIIGEDGPQTLAEVRKLVGIEAPTKKVEIKDEEVKYEILE